MFMINKKDKVNYKPSAELLKMDEKLDSDGIKTLLHQYIIELINNQDTYELVKYSTYEPNFIDASLLDEFMEINHSLLENTKLNDKTTLYFFIGQSNYIFPNLFLQYRKEKEHIFLCCSCGIPRPGTEEERLCKLMYHSEDNHNYEAWVLEKLMQIKF